MIKLEYRDVEADFSAIVNDGQDEDHDPDRTPMTGTVEFIPVYQQPGVIVHNELIRPQTIDATIHDGKLLVSRMSPEDPDMLTYQPLRLPVTVGEHLNQDWHYRVRFSGVRVEGEEQAIPDVLLPVEPGEGPVQLWVDAAEKVGSVVRQRGPAGPGIASIESEGGQVTMTLENGESTTFTIPTVKGEQGPPGELPGVTTEYVDNTAFRGHVSTWGPLVNFSGVLKASNPGREVLPLPKETMYFTAHGARGIFSEFRLDKDGQHFVFDWGNLGRSATVSGTYVRADYP